jgi:hypothetical protein
MTPGRFDDAEAVAPVIAVIIGVATTVALAAVLYAVVQGFGKQENDEPRVVMSVDDNGGRPGGTLTIIQIHNGPVDVGNVVLGGSSHLASPCMWTRMSGALQPGDQLFCDASGSITLAESTFQVLLYSGSFD